MFRSNYPFPPPLPRENHGQDASSLQAIQEFGPRASSNVRNKRGIWSVAVLLGRAVSSSSPSFPLYLDDDSDLSLLRLETIIPLCGENRSSALSHLFFDLFFFKIGRDFEKGRVVLERIWIDLESRGTYLIRRTPRGSSWRVKSRTKLNETY